MHSDIVMFLKERSPKSVQEIRSLADKYRTAHPSKPLAKEHSILAKVGVNKIRTGKDKQNEHKEQDTRHSRRDRWVDQRLGSPRTQSCGPPRILETSWNAPGHMQKWHQPTYRRGYRGNRGTAQRRYNSRHGFTRGSKPYRGYNKSDFRSANREYASASSIMMSHPSVTKSGRLHIHPGSVNSVPCSGLRDIRCSSVGITSSFINPEDFMGKTATCVMFDGTECALPTAHAHIETPFFKGSVVALVLSSHVADIILANIVGVNDST